MQVSSTMLQLASLIAGIINPLGMKKSVVLVAVLLPLVACTQSHPERSVGGRCENCELLYSGLPANIPSNGRIATEAEPGETLTIQGTVFHKDGKTPAKNVIIYLYHTDINGIYPRDKSQPSGNVHGRLRGWVKTDAKGTYSFTTIRPASYPNSRAPQHIHVIIKEDGIAPYWIDEYLFEDDPYLTEEEKSRQEKRGGPGIVRLTKNSQGTWEGQRDIILGKNIPGY